MARFEILAYSKCLSLKKIFELSVILLLEQNSKVPVSPLFMSQFQAGSSMKVMDQISHIPSHEPVASISLKQQNLTGFVQFGVSGESNIQHSYKQAS